MIDEKTVTAVILIAGNSTRFGTGKNKNFEVLKFERTILSYSLREFSKNKYVDNLIIAIREEDKIQVQSIVDDENIYKKVKLVTGGNSRKNSVYNCLKETDSDIVIIHDGARPAIKQTYINECIENMREYEGVTIGVQSKDTIKITDNDNIVLNTTTRSNTWIIQTPQCFNRKLLTELHEKYKNDEMTDDCMLLEKGGYNVKILKGDYTNLKVTTYEDLSILKSFIDKIDKNIEEEKNANK